MQMLDRKWLGMLRSMKVSTNLDGSYMDDGRNFLAPFKAGWRWNEGRIEFRQRWKMEDSGLSGLEITRRIWMGSLTDMEDYPYSQQRQGRILRMGGYQPWTAQ